MGASSYLLEADKKHRTFTGHRSSPLVQTSSLSVNMGQTVSITPVSPSHTIITVGIFCKLWYIKNRTIKN